MSEPRPIVILVPVYGRALLLEEALTSVLNQTESNWTLLIADDGSDAFTRQWLDGWITRHSPSHSISLLRRSANLGLFANLNDAIENCAADWMVLLCSDDRLNRDALATLAELRHQWPAAELILSTFTSIGPDGELRPPDSANHHDRLSRQTALIPPDRFVPALLELGSLNGNLTGMAFRRELWRRAGRFHDHWRHAADWEWLIRAAEQGPLLLNRRPIAAVRTHDDQLSNANRISGHELPEIAAVVGQLRRHALLRQEPRRNRWAAHLMQFQLWNLLKQLRQGKPGRLLAGLAPIQQGAGLLHTYFALLIWLPERWRRHRRGGGSGPKHFTNTPSP
jgi:glycosyltransferase involved in cell wall biosynthesis